MINLRTIGFSLHHDIFGRDYFEVFGDNGLDLVTDIDAHDRGIYANFSDNQHHATMEGGFNGDVLIGGSGDDHIFGGDGDDRIVAGPGFDQITGGEGADVFTFKSVDDFQGRKSDKIFDFSGVNGESDKLDFTEIADFDFMESGHFDASGSAEVIARVSKTGFFVFGDVDGDGSADFSLKIRTEGALSQLDFVSARQSSIQKEALFQDSHLFGFGLHFEPLGAVAHLALM